MKKFISIIMAMILTMSLFTACSKKEGPAAPEVTQEPTPTPKVLNQNPYTGEEQAFDYNYGQRGVAVMVNNIMQYNSIQIAWPHRGLSAADAIFEMETEGGITRMMALFRDYTKMPVVGPIRSARDQFVQIMFPLNPYYVHDGQSTFAKKMLEDYGYADRDLQPNKGIAFRDRTGRENVATEHTEFTSGELIQASVESGKYDTNTKEIEPANMFEWVDYDLPDRVLPDGDVSKIDFRFSNSYAGTITYLPETNTYMKEHTYLQYNFTKPLVDADNSGKNVEFDNVFVLWTTIEPYEGTYLSDVELNFGGVGYYFCGGKYEKVRWMKGNPYDPLRIVSMDGTETPVEINPGKSYISFVDLDYFGTFEFDDVPVDTSGEYATGDELGVDEGTGEVESEE